MVWHQAGHPRRGRVGATGGPGAAGTTTGRVRRQPGTRSATHLSHKWHGLPLSVRLAAITTSLVTLGVVISAMATTSLLYTQLLSQVDDQLRATSLTIGSQGLQQIKAGTSSSIPSTYYVHAQYLTGETGDMISPDTASEYGTPRIGTLSLDEAIAQGDDVTPWTVDSDLLGHQWRVIQLPIKDGDGSYVGVVAIALPLSNVMETVERIRLVTALAGMVVTVLGAVAATYLVRRSLRPLRQIEGVAGRIAGGDLGARVAVTEPAVTEVGSLQRSLNAMLTQNEQAFAVRVVAQQRMQRFVSDASHELRTPLAAICGYGELYRIGGVPPARTGEVMGRIESEATRMSRLVEDLLQLARMDEGRALEVAPVDLTALASAALSDLVVLSPHRPSQVVALDGVAETAPLTVMGDRDRLSQVLTNLLGNVVRYTPEDSPVEIALGADGGHAVVEVRDHGPGVPPQDAQRVFERFYRADTSRNRETGGSGLGLAIVATIVDMHGGTAAMVATPGGGATVRIVLPLPAPAEGQADGGPRAGSSDAPRPPIEGHIPQCQATPSAQGVARDAPGGIDSHR